MNMTTRQQRQLLEAVMYRLTLEQRREVMAELPQAYNAWCEREVVKVILP